MSTPRIISSNAVSIFFFMVYLTSILILLSPPMQIIHQYFYACTVVVEFLLRFYAVYYTVVNTRLSLCFVPSILLFCISHSSSTESALTSASSFLFKSLRICGCAFISLSLFHLTHKFLFLARLYFCTSVTCHPFIFLRLTLLLSKCSLMINTSFCFFPLYLGTFSFSICFAPPF